MTTDIDAINEMFSAGSLTLFIDLLTLQGIVAIMFWFNAHLALWSLCAVPPLLIILNFFGSRSRVIYREIRERLAALNAYLAESLAGMAVVQLFTREKRSREEFEALNLKSRDAQMVANIYEAGSFFGSRVAQLSDHRDYPVGRRRPGDPPCDHGRDPGRVPRLRAHVLHAAA